VIKIDKKVIRSLTIKAFHIEDVEISNKTKIEKGKLSISSSLITNNLFESELIESVKVKILTNKDHNCYINTIMDIIPISTKVLGRIGDGITHTLTGVYVMLTGADENGKQMAEFGSSDGVLSEQMVFGRAGTPGRDDIIIHIDVSLKGNKIFNRNLVNSAFKYSDVFIQFIREELKKLDGRNSDEVHKFEDVWNTDKKRVYLVKQVAGQGAMYDNLLFPEEPSGYKGGRSIIDLANVPIVLSPNEYRDGAIRALT